MTNKYPADLHTIKLFYEAVNDVDDIRTFGEHITQLLIDLYDTHLITCCHCGAINRVENDKKYLDSYGDYIFDCVGCGQGIDYHDCTDLFY